MNTFCHTACYVQLNNIVRLTA